MKIVSRKIKLELANQKLTVADLSRKSGLSTFTINRVINGSHNVLPKTAGALADALGLPAEQLIDMED